MGTRWQRTTVTLCLALCSIATLQCLGGLRRVTDDDRWSSFDHNFVPPDVDQPQPKGELERRVEGRLRGRVARSEACSGPAWHDRTACAASSPAGLPTERSPPHMPLAAAAS